MASNIMKELQEFSESEMLVVNTAVAMAEEVVSEYYKMSSGQWLRNRYDVKTLLDLSEGEIVHGPLAQIVRYGGARKDSSLGSGSFDFYKICLQDHAILNELKKRPEINLQALLLYIVTHELVHVVRFGKFIQFFDAPVKDKASEELIVHSRTCEILKNFNVKGLGEVFKLYGDID